MASGGREARELTVEEREANIAEIRRWYATQPDEESTSPLQVRSQLNNLIELVNLGFDTDGNAD